MNEEEENENIFPYTPMMVWLAYLISFAMLMIIVILIKNATGAGEGIYPLDERTVYISGESCTVNATENISVVDMEESFQRCIEKHIELTANN